MGTGEALGLSSCLFVGSTKFVEIYALYIYFYKELVVLNVNNIGQ